MKKLFLAALLISMGSVSAINITDIAQQHIVEMYNAGVTIEEVVTQENADVLGISLETLQELASVVFSIDA